MEKYCNNTKNNPPLSETNGKFQVIHNMLIFLVPESTKDVLTYLFTIYCISVKHIVF